MQTARFIRGIASREFPGRLGLAGMAGGLVVLAAGCGSTRPIAAWQERLTQYTMEHGGGDPSVLRESSELRSPQSVRPAQIKFSHRVPGSGIPPFVGTHDVHGVLVGQDGTGENPSYYFLVGVVERPFGSNVSTLSDLRLAACSVRGKEHQWKVGEASPAALHEYLSALGSSSERGRHETFPQLDDAFRLEVRDGQALATDVRSGATWSVSQP